MNRAGAIITSSRETLVFRDGRPFGAEGNLTGGRISWPLPSTVAGMIRSRIGLSRNTREPGYFGRGDPIKRSKNIWRLLDLHITGLLPIHRRLGEDRWSVENLLFPAPADAAIFPEMVGSGSLLSIRRFSCKHLAPDEGCADIWANWMLPHMTGARKPARRPPAFWNMDRFLAWLREEDLGSLSSQELGVAGATLETRVHNSINPDTLTVLNGALFDSPGIRLAVRFTDVAMPDELGLVVFLNGLEDDDDATGSVHFGGERRIALNETFEGAFPSIDAIKETLTDRRFIRLVLVTPGSFGCWVPSWLLPEPCLRNGLTPWMVVPKTAARVRLCSAFVPGWSPLSGWNYDTRSRKAMRKVVPAGSVYVLEVEKREESFAIASALWGKSICDPQVLDRSEPPPATLPPDHDGFGVVVVGCADKLCGVVTGL